MTGIRSSTGNSRRALYASALLYGLLVCPLMAQHVDYSRPFDWDDAIPLLHNAIEVAPKEGVTLLLEGLPLLRAGIASDLQKTCPSGEIQHSDPICHAQLGDAALEDVIDEEIRKIVETRMRAHGSMFSADYDFTPLIGLWPYRMIVAFRSRFEPYAALDFYLSSGEPTARFRGKYGSPSKEWTDQDHHVHFRYEFSDEASQRVIALTANVEGSAVSSVFISLKRN